MPSLLVAGDMMDPEFREAYVLAEDIAANNKSLKIEKREMAETDFNEYLSKKLARIGGAAKEHTGPFIAHSKLGFLGGVDNMLQWASKTYNYPDPRQNPEYAHLKTLFDEENTKAFHQHIYRTGHKFAFMDFTFGSDAERHRVIFELFSKECPITCNNFLTLCAGTRPVNGDGAKMAYKGTRIHRVMKDGWIQGGDLLNGKGGYSCSIFGPTFADEALTETFDKPGVLGMVNNGPHTNGSQFFVTMKAMQPFNNRKVAFGRVAFGQEVLNRINRIPTRNQTPRENVTVVDCGEIKPMAKREVVKEEYTGPWSSTTVVMVGLDNAGKTTIQNHFESKPTADVTPTNGFELGKCKHARSEVTVFGLGGGKGIRSYWQNYYDEVHGLVFVIDASDMERLFEACDLVRECAKHPQAADKPILIFLNKQDLNPLSATELVLDLDELKCPTHVVTCKALENNELAGSSPVIMEGLAWLVGQVDADREALEERVKRDVKVRKEREKAEREERRRRREEERAQKA